MLLKAKLLYIYAGSVRLFVHPSVISSSFRQFRHFSIDFQLYMMVPLTVRYDLGSVATLSSLSERPYIHLKHALQELLFVVLPSEIRACFYGCYSCIDVSGELTLEITKQKRK